MCPQLLHHALQEPKNARVLFVDMNGFFASVEQQDNPALQGKPVGVVSHLHPHGTILASSYEAKACGVTTGTKIAEARILCPEIILTPGHMRRYQDIHKQFMAILVDLCGPEVQARSIDEAAIYLSPNWQDSTLARSVALTIKERFRQELGPYIRCSIGIAPNSLLAKVATNLQKPDGLVEITLENTTAILSKLSLTDLPGIASRMERRLNAAGVYSPLHLYSGSTEQLRKDFGIWGQYWWWRLHGFECDGFHEPSLKTMSHEHVLHRWLHKRTDLEATSLKMADRLLNRLYRNQLECKHLFIALKLVGAPSYYAERKLDAPTANNLKILQAFRDLIQEVPEQFPFPVRKIVVGFTQLSAKGNGSQLDIFGDSTRGDRIGQTIGMLREKFGYNAVHLGNVVNLSKSIAPETVGFGRVKDR